jgi:NADH dehydrogenase [ubiquinone] 1 alpha subcomplex assembly factor 7
MTPNEREIRARIARDGPLPVAEFMRIALSDPAHGYYRARDGIGRGGDFVTAPEISQAFGELIGLWCAVTWQHMGAPARVRLVELGPGHGTLMADALRAAAAVPAFRAALDIHLVEASPRLAAIQRDTLAGADAQWHESFGEVPPGPALVIANEFFDALPIDQYVRTADGWRRRAVVVDPAADRLAFADVACETAGLALPDATAGTVYERSPETLALAAAIGGRLARSGGAALIVDYGPLRRSPGESLQAVRGHGFADVLDAPGTADLSAHVDFASLAGAARAAGARAFGPVTQRAFLRRLGIEVRLAQLAAAAPGRDSVVDSGARLIDPAGMGTLFKVLALADRGLPVPAGFEAAEEQREQC